MFHIFFSIIVFVNICFGSAYVINSTEIDGKVLTTNFDSDGNIFVITEQYPSFEQLLHKLTSTDELLWTISLPKLSSVDKGPKLLVTSQNDVYVRYASYDDGVTVLYVVKSGSSNLTEIDHVLNICDLFILDNNDNLYYCGANAAVKILRPNSTSPTEIKNLENYIVFREESATVDREGNVYFAIAQLSNRYSDESLALITKKEIENQVPQAQLIDFFQRDNETSSKIYVSSLIVDEENDLWLFITDLSNLVGYVRKLKNGVLENVYEDYSRGYVQGLVSKDRLYVIAQAGNQISDNTSIFYITADGSAVLIPQLTNITQLLFRIRVNADKEGNAYFAAFADFTSELGAFFVIKPDQADPVPIEFVESNYQVSYMRPDSDGILWIIAYYEVFTLEKESTTPKKISDFANSCNDININPVTKEVYISCYGGLFHVVNEK